VGGDKANSGRRREWEDTRLTQEGTGSGRAQGQLGKAQGVGGHRPTREGAGSGRTQGRLYKAQGVGGDKADSGRRREVGGHRANSRRLS
jgi:hypothetical protein